MARSDTNYILYLSTYPPRECGIATFTNDLATSFDLRFNPTTKSKVLALNESETVRYNYPKRVIGAIAADRLERYVELANKINLNKDIKLVNIQHEFGIFGGEWGDYLIPFLQVIEKPIIVTLHSVLPQPSDYLKRTVQLIGEYSKGIVVMNDRSRTILEAEYAIPKSKIFCIPHGIPHATFESSKDAKQELGLEGKIVLSTFGLISKDKGIEYAIQALPAVVKAYPNVIYLILGITHPQVRAYEGEAYRNFLMNEVSRLHLNEHVQFYNKYLSLEEIISYLKATDIYISIPVNPMQSVSGTLSYALGCGRAVISTPTEYAKYLINEGNGALVKFNDPYSIAQATKKLLRDQKKLNAMHRQAYATTRHMTWPNVAAAYFKLYKKFGGIRAEEKKLPPIKLDHLIRLTDDFGIIQHARYEKPNRRYGYCLDDNARALIVAARSYTKDPQPVTLELIKKYLNFIKFVQRPSGHAVNTVSTRRERGNDKDEDALGRAVWALGYVAAAESLPHDIVTQAEHLLSAALKPLSRIVSPRAIAFAMTGLYHYLKRYPKQPLKRLLVKLADRQVRRYSSSASPQWQWYEDQLTYSNSKLPESLFYAYDLTRNPSYRTIAETSLQFLRNITFGKQHYSPIGQAGWYFRNRERKYFDQQPEDTASMVETKIAAYRVTKDKRHLDDAFTAFEWFLGRNHLNQMVYDDITGGCHDGVGQNTLNMNQGAESTISYLLARLAIDTLSNSDGAEKIEAA